MLPWFDAASIQLLNSYAVVLVFLVVAALMGTALVIVSLICGPKKPDSEKFSTYECGFEPFGDSRMKFDVRFYLVAILFIIFDLEVAFLFPWSICLKELGWLGLQSVLVFLFILMIGFVYEWKKGALEWE